ncbi:site-specific integrase [Collimonas pratensis]|uniref:Phage integrase family protein n=1 Tax=Collimonas pratensis TaxID=279113 RepID=A0ABM5Z5F5_9BURK|nr:site-specific integrase [Collimonas pratensis]AMP14390.1 phage integrase family protein [Collimonas pratensis]
MNIGNASWQKKKPDPFTIEEAQKIVASMLERYPQPVANYFEFMFFTGLRTSEGIGLEWNDVDFNTKTILVRQGFVLGKMEDTKTSKERTVSLNSMAFAALKRQKAWTFLQEGGRVFHDPATNEPWPDEQNARRRHWIPTLRLLGIRYRRPYSMRSTYATIGLMAGANPAYIAGQLGHGVDVFFKDYAAWINGKHNATELDKIEAQIQGNIPKLSLANIKQA